MNAYEAAVEEIKILLGRANSALVDVFLRLRIVEMEGVWKLQGDHAHFGDFLKKNFPNAMGLEKYTNGIRAIELYGEEIVRKVGVEAAHAMCVSAITSSDERRNKLVASIQTHIEDYGVAPCRDTIRNIVKGIAPEIQKPHKTTRSILEIERLRSENNELRKEVKLLQKKVKELEGKLHKKRARAVANA